SSAASDVYKRQTKNTALDFADNPVIVVLKKAHASLSAIPATFYHISSDAKFRLLLACLKEEGTEKALVFCNLRQTSKEVEVRLRLNHIPAQHVSAAAPAEKNAALFKRFREGDTPLVLVVSNDNLEVLPSEIGKHAIHYDIPLDADIYLERVRTLDSGRARMVGLVCERYEVGLSAIESRFGIHLQVKEIEEGTLASEDLSAGVPLDLKSNRRVPEREQRRRADVTPREKSIPGGQQKSANARKPNRTRPLSAGSGRGSAPHENAARRRNFSEKQGKNPASSRLDADALYRMSSEERLAYFRDKYRTLLKSPPAQGPVPSESPHPSSEQDPPGEGILKRLIGKLFSSDDTE
ncbi:MAG: DEAD/DEAH box helicase, partial [Rectinema sp.]|nr:DEAD/DEAH box helicase [Rectinema sp.]